MKRNQSGAAREADWPYSQKDFRDIAESLGRSSLPPEEEAALRTAALTYLNHWLGEAPEDGRTLKDHRSALKNIIKRAEQIMNQFERLNLEVGRDFNKARWAKDLADLQQDAHRVLESLPPRRLRKRARHHFVDLLADIYEPLIGRRAGLSKKYKPCGPFYRFVVAALKPLKLPREDPIDGIDKFISEVAKERRKGKPR
jgi:hypothetical protein